MTTKKKKYRVEVVAFGKNLKIYARDLEKIANELDDAGYRFQLSDQKTGTVLFGQFVGNATVVAGTPESLLEMLAGNAPNTSHFTPRTRELVGRFFNACGDHHNDPDAFSEVAKKQATTLLKGFSVRELTGAAEEIDREAVAHAETHDAKSDEMCHMPALLRHVANIVREHIQLQLQ